VDDKRKRRMGAKHARVSDGPPFMRKCCISPFASSWIASSGTPRQAGHRARWKL
jgi:hypothetical protein